MRRLSKPGYVLLGTGMTWLLTGCGGGGGATDAQLLQPPQTKLSCDDSMKTAFKPDALTTLLLVNPKFSSSYSCQ
jgi:hypothetical protein